MTLIKWYTHGEPDQNLNYVLEKRLVEFESMNEVIQKNDYPNFFQWDRFKKTFIYLYKFRML